MKAVKAPCDCQLDSFEPLTVFNKHVYVLSHPVI